MTKGTLSGTRHKKLSNIGFRIRMRTARGRRIIKSRRKRGRKLITRI